MKNLEILKHRTMKDFFFNTIQEFNDFIGVETLHPLISIARIEDTSPIQEAVHHYGLYALFLKENKGCKLSYGRTEYDFDEMTVTSFAPGQSIKVEPIPNIRYWLSIPTCSTALSLARASPDTSSSIIQATKHYTYPLPRSISSVMCSQ